MNIEEALQYFMEQAASPRRLLSEYKSAGKKVIGIMPYYVPEELVYAAGMVPMGMWGNSTQTISKAKEYCPTFYCSLAQLDLEMLLNGTMDELDGVITSTMCDTLRPMSQNVRVAVEGKFPMIFLAHPQNRFDKSGMEFTCHQYQNIRLELEKISGKPIEDKAIWKAITVYNASRAARREFVRLAGQHPEAVSALARCAVLKSAWFLEKDVYTEKLKQLNAMLTALPERKWDGVRVVTSGIICDNPRLLKIFDENHIAIGADDVSHESRSFRVDAPECGDNPIMALAQQFASQDQDPMLFDCRPAEERRITHLQKLVKESGSQCVVIFMMQFCDPEETDYPYIKNGLTKLGIPNIKLGFDQQMRDFGQISTSLQACADMFAE